MQLFHLGPACLLEDKHVCHEHVVTDILDILQNWGLEGLWGSLSCKRFILQQGDISRIWLQPLPFTSRSLPAVLGWDIWSTGEGLPPWWLLQAGGIIFEMDLIETRVPQHSIFGAYPLSEKAKCLWTVKSLVRLEGPDRGEWFLPDVS